MSKYKKGKDVMVSKKVVCKKVVNIIFLLSIYVRRQKTLKIHLRKMPLSRN
jgi:hypothetical protein